MINQTDKELFEAFSDIYFEEDIHKYTDSAGTDYTSVTTWVGKFEPDKDWDKIAEKCLKKPENAGKTIKSLRAEWKSKGDYACALGTCVHSVLELLAAKKDFKPDSALYEKFEGLQKDFEWRKQKAKEMFAALKKVYVPIRTEFIVYDRDWKLCGTIDGLYYNLKKDCYSILDWKTSKKFDRANRYAKMKKPFETEDDCNTVHYSMQLSAYKAILEKHCPSIKIGEMMLVQIPSEETGKAEVFDCHDYSKKITEYLDGNIPAAE